MKTYTICRKQASFSWDSIPRLAIDTLLWSEKVPISAGAQLCYDDEAIYVKLTATEPHMRAEEEGPLGAPCEDSCLEFFFSPIAGDNRYFNIEFNPNGCMYLGLGSNVQNLVRLIPEQNPIVPQICRTTDGWALEYSIPYTFIRRFFPGFSPASGDTLRANCYKCGDSTVQPHFLSWNPIALPEPCFHCPEFFGTMVFE